jgi:hypothetical protein
MFWTNEASSNQGPLGAELGVAGEGEAGGNGANPDEDG